MKDQSLYLPGIHDALVLKAMHAVRRELFVPPELRPRAYDDGPLPIGHGQTISQPFIVAFMTQALALKVDTKVLEVGTGSGYQSAVLSRITDQVYSTEIRPDLVELARSNLQAAGITSVHQRQSDGYAGWPEEAPFDAIIVTAAAPRIPEPLLAQLAPGGRLIIPVGERHAGQELVLVRRDEAAFVRTSLLAVRFVPMVGEVRRDPGPR